MTISQLEGLIYDQAEEHPHSRCLCVASGPGQVPHPIEDRKATLQPMHRLLQPVLRYKPCAGPSQGWSSADKEVRHSPRSPPSRRTSRTCFWWPVPWMRQIKKENKKTSHQPRFPWNVQGFPVLTAIPFGGPPPTRANSVAMSFDQTDPMGRVSAPWRWPHWWRAHPLGFLRFRPQVVKGFSAKAPR